MRSPIVLCSIALAALVVAGCGSSSSTTSTTTHTVTTAVTTPSATATVTHTVAVTPTTSASSGLDGVPAYEPSSVVSQGTHTLVLTSKDSTGQVGAFYAAKLSGDGWVTVSKTVDPTHANFTVKKNGQGATIAVAPAGSGSSISISSYPLP